MWTCRLLIYVQYRKHEKSPRAMRAGPQFQQWGYSKARWIATYKHVHLGGTLVYSDCIRIEYFMINCIVLYAWTQHLFTHKVAHLEMWHRGYIALSHTWTSMHFITRPQNISLAQNFTDGLTKTRFGYKFYNLPKINLLKTDIVLIIDQNVSLFGH